MFLGSGGPGAYGSGVDHSSVSCLGPRWTGLPQSGATRSKRCDVVLTNNDLVGGSLMIWSEKENGRTNRN